MNIKDNLKRLAGPIPMRLFASLMTVLTFTALFRRDIFLKVAETEKISSLVFAISILSVFAILTGLFFSVKRTFFDKAAALTFGIIYLAVICIDSNNVLTGAVCAACSAILIFAVYRPLTNRDISRGVSAGIVAVTGIAIAIFIGVITVLRYLCFHSPNFDFGIWCNMFYHMKEEFAPIVSCERDKLLSHFAVHISPIWYLILPFYCIFPSPITLQAAQAIILASGVIPIYLLGRKFGFSRGISAIWCGIYALFPALSGGCFYDIHENCFLTPLLLWLFYFFECKKTLPMYLFAVLTLCVKEDAAVYVAFIAIYMLLSGKNKRDGGILFILSVICFLVESHILNTYGDGVMNYRYDNYFTGDGNMINVAINVIKNPSLVLQNILKKEKIEFILSMLVPLGFIPFMCKRKVSRLVLICPLILVNLMTDYVYQYNINFQYVFGTLSFLIYASIITVSEFNPDKRHITSVACLIMTAMMFFSTSYKRFNITENYIQNKETYGKIEAALDKVPDDAKVTCSTFYISHIADRDEIYDLKCESASLGSGTTEIRRLYNIHDSSCFVLDIRYAEEQKFDRYLSEDEDWTCIAREDGLVSVWIKK